jgi:hypothetical protein
VHIQESLVSGEIGNVAYGKGSQEPEAWHPSFQWMDTLIENLSDQVDCSSGSGYSI